MLAAAACGLLGWGAVDASAATLPGSSDAGRVDIEHKQAAPEGPPPAAAMPEILLPGAEIPKGAEKVKVTLQDIDLEGVTAFPKEEIEALYRPYIGKQVTLDTVWHIADLITAHYQKAGYFLSRAFVPPQTIKDGILVIHVVEGYVGEVQFDDPLAESRIVSGLTEQITAERPLTSRTLEGVMLRLNDLPGVSLRSVIEPLEDERKKDGAVKLVLVRADKPGKGSVSFDNYNSRFLGPYEGIATYKTSLLPLQETSVSGLSSIPADKLQYITASHTIAITADLSAQLYAGYTKANPGFTLKPEQVESDARNIGLSIKEQFIRQRQENLSASLIFDAKDSNSDVLQAPLTRDRIRAARANLSYDRADPLGGYNYASLTVSRGLPVLNANSPGEPLISRLGAEPDFTKLDYSLTHFQPLVPDWTSVASVSGQKASGPLYSPEQFGYGGQAFGRAYDPSEILGDSGVAGSLELRYGGLPPLRGAVFTPFGFYDIGKVWSDGAAATSGASAGLGVRADSGFGLTGALTVAEPLTRPLADPQYGNGKSPRCLFQVMYGF